MTGYTTHNDMNDINQSLSPGVIVLTLAVLAIVFMVGFHLMSRTDTTIPENTNGLNVSGGLVHSNAYDETGSEAPKTYSR